jgi:hypothetical protein
VANTTNKRVITECKAKPWWKNIKEGVGDPSRPDLIKEWKDDGITIVQANNDVEPGIEAVRDALAPVLGKAKFFVNRKCRHWMREVLSYCEKNGKPVKENDHTQDETRYFVMRYIKPSRKVGIRRVA